MKTVMARVVPLLLFVALSLSCTLPSTATDMTTALRGQEETNTAPEKNDKERRDLQIDGQGQTCSNGIEGIDGNGLICCPLNCGQCAGPGCSTSGAAYGLGADSCCSRGVQDRGGYCDETNEAPCIYGSSTIANTCSNGIEGIDGNGVICCPLACNQCGGSGCATSGAAASLGKDSCCGEGVKARDEYCDETNKAPCIVGSRPAPVSADCGTKRNVAGSDVVLLMGQSNMSGWGQGYDEDLDAPDNARIQQWSRANTVITALERLEHADFGATEQSRVGMGTSFGRAYIDTLPANRNVLLVPTAYRGTQLVDGPWSVGGNLFEDAVTRMEAALASNEAAGNCVAAVLWHQGESDADEYVDQDTYQAAWTDMINTLRNRIPAAAEAPVILGEFTPATIEENPERTAPILAAIRAIPDSVPFTAVAPSDGLSTNPDDELHFDATSQRQYGQRYFEELGEAIRNDQQ